MAKDPAILFYTSDFLTGTITMDNEQVGMYIRLLCIQHQKGRLSERDMLKICITHDVDVFNKFDRDEKGYFNKRLEREVVRRKKYSESRSKNRKGKVNISTSCVVDMETETETITVNKTKAKTEKKEPEIIELIFPFDTDEFKKWWGYWKEYKSKEHGFKYKSPISEQAALKELSKKSNMNEPLAIAIIEHTIANGWKGFIVPKSENKVTASTIESNLDEIRRKKEAGYYD